MFISVLCTYAHFPINLQLLLTTDVLLPPIIFDAGFNITKTHFFHNLGTLTLFAVLGTVVSTLVIGFSLYAAANIGLVTLDTDSPRESLMFGALISAVDPVATLASRWYECSRDGHLRSLHSAHTNLTINMQLSHTYSSVRDAGRRQDVVRARVWRIGVERCCVYRFVQYVSSGGQHVRSADCVSLCLGFARQHFARRLARARQLAVEH
jgi:hypothetical protein